MRINKAIQQYKENLQMFIQDVRVEVVDEHKEGEHNKIKKVSEPWLGRKVDVIR